MVRWQCVSPRWIISFPSIQILNNFFYLIEGPLTVIRWSVPRNNKARFTFRWPNPGFSNVQFYIKCAAQKKFVQFERKILQPERLFVKAQSM